MIFPCGLDQINKGHPQVCEKGSLRNGTEHGDPEMLYMLALWSYPTYNDPISVSTGAFSFHRVV